MQKVTSSLSKMLKQAGVNSRKLPSEQREVLEKAILAFKDDFKSTHSDVVQPRTGKLDPEKLYDSLPDGRTRLADKKRYSKEMTKVMEAATIVKKMSAVQTPRRAHPHLDSRHMRFGDLRQRI